MYSAYNYGKWISLIADEELLNLSVCVKDGEHVRNIKDFNDYNLELVIINQVSDFEAFESTPPKIIEEGKWVRCLAITINPQLEF